MPGRVFDLTSRRRLLSAPPKRHRMATSRISLASCSRLLDARFLHDRVDSNGFVPHRDARLGHRERLSQGRFTLNNDLFIQLQSTNIISRERLLQGRHV